jgi:tetratricopeptide (TPR) repeat protein
MTTSTTLPGSKVGRGRRRLSQLWQVPTFLIGLFAIIGAAGSAPWRLTPQEREFAKLVMTLRQALEQGESGDAVVGHAEMVDLRLHLSRSRSAEAHFLVGSAYYRQAQQKPAILAKDIWPRAIEHLEEARARGVSDADKAALQYRLGFSLYQQKTELPRAIELMMLGVEKGAEQPLQGYQLLVQANLKQTPPSVDGALSASARVLDLTPESEIEGMALARLQHAELLLHKEMRADALKQLERIGPKASRALRVKARLLQARCCEEDGFWAKAIVIWQELLADTTLVEGGRARVLYALGWCHHKLDPNNDETQRVWSEALKFGGPDGQAAGLHLGKLRLPLGGQQTIQGLADWNEALEKVNSPQDYRNPHVAKEQVIEWFNRAIRQFHDAQDPQKTQTVAVLYRKLAPGGIAEFGLGEAAEALAKLLAEKLQRNLDKVTLADVEDQYRRAGAAYEQAAKARPEGERPDSLWRSAQCYISANDSAQAQQIILQFVKLEPREPRLAEAWHTLGDLYRLERKKDNAHDAYLKCLQYPNTLFAYRSRYYLAVEEIEKRNLMQALDILKQNLVGGSGEIDIERAWQEKSQFKMALLLMEMRNYGEAEVHLKEFLKLFPENQYALVARDQLGECYRCLAKIEQVEQDTLQNMIKGDTPPELLDALKDQVQRRNEARLKLLMAAVKTHQELSDELQRTFVQNKQLSPHEQTLLRRARLGIGGCHLDDERFAEALEIFRELQTNHRRTLEGLYASRFICYVMYKMPLQDMPKAKADRIKEQAKESVRQAAEDLKGMPADHEIFRGTGAWQREDWLRWVDEAQRQLATPPRDDSKVPKF